MAPPVEALRTAVARLPEADGAKLCVRVRDEAGRSVEFSVDVALLRLAGVAEALHDGPVRLAGARCALFSSKEECIAWICVVEFLCDVAETGGARVCASALLWPHDLAAVLTVLDAWDFTPLPLACEQLGERAEWRGALLALTYREVGVCLRGAALAATAEFLLNARTPTHPSFDDALVDSLMRRNGVETLPSCEAAARVASGGLCLSYEGLRVMILLFCLLGGGADADADEADVDFVRRAAGVDIPEACARGAARYLRRSAGFVLSPAASERLVQHHRVEQVPAFVRDAMARGIWNYRPKGYE